MRSSTSPTPLEPPASFRISIICVRSKVSCPAPSAVSKECKPRASSGLPERPLFSREKVEASASIVLKVRGALEPQRSPIRHLVATAVNGLSRNASPSSTKAVNCLPTALRLTIRSAASARMSESSPTKIACAAKLKPSCRRWWALAARACKSRGFRCRSHYADIGQVRSRWACCTVSQTREEQSAAGARGDGACPSATNCQAAIRAAEEEFQLLASKTKRPRKSSITKSPARPRRK